MTGEHPDAGARAVARVRGVREQDSRLGLRRASADELEARRRAEAVAERLAEHRTTDAGLGGFLAGRVTGLALAADASAARAARDSAATVTAAARAHWSSDRSRLAAIELLLERREEARRAERARREATELDDLALTRWLRSRRGEAGA